MALLKFKDITKMDKKLVEGKLKELKLALTKAYVTANKANAKTKEIKRAIARLITYSTSLKREKLETKK